MNVLNLETRNDMATRHSEHASVYTAWANGLIKSASTSTCCANENVLLKEALLNYSTVLADDYRASKSSRNEYPTLSAVSIGTPAFDVGRVVAKHKLQVKLRLHRVTHFSDCNLNEIGLPAASGRQRNPTPDGVRPSGGSGATCAAFSSHRNLDSILVNRCGNDGEGAILNFAAVNDSVIRNRVGIAGAAASYNVHLKGAPLDYPERASLERRPSNDVLETAAAESTSVMREHSNSAPSKGDRSLEGGYLASGSLAEEGRSVGRHNDSVPDVEPTSQLCDSDEKSLRCITSNDRTTNYGCVKCSAVENRSETSPDPLPERRRKSGIFVQHFAECNVADESNDTETTPPTRDRAASNDEEIAPPSPPKDEQRPRRSSSLKMPKLNDSTSAQKKIVRFADALGLDLADVRTFLDELPSIPKSAYNDLQNDESAERVTTQQPVLSAETAKTLVPMFKQPHTSFNFLDRIRDNFVVLEFAKVSPSPVCAIGGTVRVRNLDFCKSVYVRYTMDNWQTFNELQAAYVLDSCDGFSDKFAFAIYVYDVKANQRVELAVRFHCGGCIHWDNNNGSNYVFQCLPSAPIGPSYFQFYAANDDVSNSFF